MSVSLTKTLRGKPDAIRLGHWESWSIMSVLTIFVEFVNKKLQDDDYRVEFEKVYI